MISEHRLQVYLPNQLYKSLLDKALKDGKSIAQVVRESVSLYLARSPKEQAMEGYASLDRMVGAFRDDGAGVAEEHDDALGAQDGW